jgi:hypothetical protein
VLGLKETGDGEITQVKGGLAALWAAKPVVAITSKDVGDLIRDVRRMGIPGLERRNREASDARARGLHSCLSAFFNWLKDEQQITISPLTALKRPKPPTARERFLTEEEVRKFWLATDQVGEPFGSTLKLMLLTGARKLEVAGMRPLRAGRGSHNLVAAGDADQEQAPSRHSAVAASQGDHRGRQEPERGFGVQHHRPLADQWLVEDEAAP